MAGRDQKGNILLMLVFGIVVLACLGGFYYAMDSASNGNRKLASDPKLVMQELQERVERAFANPTAIDASLERNPNQFACLFTVTAACRGYGGTFLLYETPQGQPVSQLIKTNGISFDGAGCTGYPSESCPFRVETSWTPACAPGACENTKSVNLHAVVSYNTGNGDPLTWTKDALFTPALRLSQGVMCERGGGIWAGTECLTPDQAAQRKVASALPRKLPPPSQGLNDARDAYNREQAENGGQGQVGIPPAEEFICPDSMPIQGQVYTLEQLGNSRAQVHVPALNNCPAEDLFVFQCTAKNPASFEGEGQWVQVEAVMAPACDERGTPLGQGIRN